MMDVQYGVFRVESKSSLEWVKNQAREKKRIIIARYLNLHYLVVFNRK